MNFYILLTLAAGILIGVVWMYVDVLWPHKKALNFANEEGVRLRREKDAYRLRVLKAEGAIQKLVDDYDHGRRIGPTETRDYLSTTIGYKEGKS